MIEYHRINKASLSLSILKFYHRGLLMIGIIVLPIILSVFTKDAIVAYVVSLALIGIVYSIFFRRQAASQSLIYHEKILVDYYAMEFAFHLRAIREIIANRLFTSSDKSDTDIILKSIAEMVKKISDLEVKKIKEFKIKHAVAEKDNLIEINADTISRSDIVYQVAIIKDMVSAIENKLVAEDVEDAMLKLKILKATLENLEHSIKQLFEFR